MLTHTHFTEKGMLKALRGIHPYGTSETLMKRCTVIRKIKHFPKNSNQASYAYLCYDGYGCIIMAIQSYYISDYELKKSLPKRIIFIEDECYIYREKDFKQYINLPWHSSENPESELVKYYKF